MRLLQTLLTRPGLKWLWLQQLLWLNVLTATVAFAADERAAAPRWMTPQAAEIYLDHSQSPLMADSHNDHVVSLYFFGEYQDRTLIGLERVKGDDYEQFFSLLVFEKKQLLGYYQNVASFPSQVQSDGRVIFPKRFRPQPRQPGEFFSLAGPSFPALCFSASDTCVSWQRYSN